MQGLAKTRLSVQTLNRILVTRLIRHGVNAAGISPCLAIPLLQAHGGGDSPDATRQARASLERIIRDALQAGIVPVLHGDAGLYGRRDAGILSGDIIMEHLGQASWVSHAIFLTDVDGVFSSDPRNDPNASLLRNIVVDKRTLDILEPVLDVSGSSHDHDVTGGLKVSLSSDFFMWPRSIPSYFRFYLTSLTCSPPNDNDRQSLLPQPPLQHRVSMSQLLNGDLQVLKKPCFETKTQ